MDEFKQFTFIVATETLLLTLPYYFMLSYSNHRAMLLNTGKKKKNKTVLFSPQVSSPVHQKYSLNKYTDNFCFGLF